MFTVINYLFVVLHVAQQEMGMSDAQAHQALETCYEEFIRFVPVDDLCFKLERKGIISDRQKIDIRNCPYRDEKAEKLYDILLKSRTAADFIAFCQLLQEHSVKSTQQFGRKLLNQARSSTG